MASTPWLLHHDLDHVASDEFLRQVLSLATPENQNVMFRFLIEFPEGRVVVSSSAHLITADWFWRLGGMDEDFAGNYGFDDVYFLVEAHKADGLKVMETLQKFQADPQGAAQMVRDIQRNEILIEEKRRQPPTHPGQVLRFPWKRVY